MKIAMPLLNDLVSEHFGHASQFVFIDINKENNQIINKEILEAPPHEPGVLPRWVHSNGANVIITGGMGLKAKQIFNSYNIEVITGTYGLKPEDIVNKYMSNSLESSESFCDHH